MKRVVPVEVTTCVLCGRTSYVADFLPAPEVSVYTVTVGVDPEPLRSLTLCEDDYARFRDLFALAAEQGLPPETDSVPAPKRSRRKGGDCQYCGKKGYENLQQHWVAVHPEKADEHCEVDHPETPGATCGYPFFTERSKARHLKVTHGIEASS